MEAMPAMGHWYTAAPVLCISLRSACVGGIAETEGRDAYIGAGCVGVSCRWPSRMTTEPDVGMSSEPAGRGSPRTAEGGGIGAVTGMLIGLVRCGKRANYEMA